ncbi:MAG: hypothetical protein OXB89_09330, partial [Anaerolineaceae bacterium]|nr:hypothetical protein [Anaerolineaceae bacterium]
MATVYPLWRIPHMVRPALVAIWPLAGVKYRSQRKSRPRQMPNEKNPDDGASRPEGDEPASAPRPEDALPESGPEPPASPGPDAGVEELTALVDALGDPASPAADLPAPEDTLPD